MLSSQTKDQVVGACMRRLQKHGLTACPYPLQSAPRTCKMAILLFLEGISFSQRCSLQRVCSTLPDEMPPGFILAENRGGFILAENLVPRYWLV